MMSLEENGFSAFQFSFFRLQVGVQPCAALIAISTFAAESSVEVSSVEDVRREECLALAS
jgi:hypothetical protein